MISKKEITVILPAYNESSVIQKVIQSIVDYGIENVIVIDDGSTDETAKIATRAGAWVYSHIINRGAGAAFQTGINLARQKQWPYVAFMDSDGQHNPRDLDQLVQKMETSRCDLVIGSRFLQKNKEIPYIRIFFNKIANLLTNIFCKNNYTDTQSGFRLFNQRAIERINLKLDGFGYCSEMIIEGEKADLKIAEIPISVHYSTYSISKGQDFQNGISTAINLLWNIIFK